MPKTAGTYVQDFLVNFMGGTAIRASNGSYHVAIKFTPEEHKNKWKFGIIRNPWDFHVSNYFYLRRVRKDNDFFRAITGGKHIDYTSFEECVYGSTHLSSTIERTKYWVEFCAMPRYQFNISDAIVQNWDYGYMTLLYILQFMKHPQDALMMKTDDLIRHHDDLVGIDTFMKTERLGDDFCRGFEEHCTRLTEDQEKRFRYSPKTNTSVHGPRKNHFDDTLREMVAQRERLLLEIHGYAFH